jgi:hypothetical protein
MVAYRPVVLIGGKLSVLPAGAVLDAKVQEVDSVEMQAKEAIISAGMPLYCNAAFQVMLADADADDKATVLGLATIATALDAYVTVQTDGVVEQADWTTVTGSATLTVGSDYFLDATPGKLTATVPIAGNLVYVGRAIAPSKLEVSIQRPIKL